MAKCRVVIVFILCLRCIFSQEPVLAFACQGGRAEFEVKFTYRLSDNDFTSLLYKSSEDGFSLLMNSSDLTYRLPSRVNYLGSRFRMNNLSLLDSGLYLTERWRNGICRERTAHYLTVCRDSLNVLVKIYNKIVEWEVKNFSIGHADRLLVYKEDYATYYEDIDKKKTLILNTTLSLLRKQDDQTAEAHVLINGSAIFIFTHTDYLGKAYHFLIWSGEHCRAYDANTFLQGYPGGGIMLPSHAFKREGENITLECHPSVKRMETFHWKTPLKDVYIDRALSANLTQEEEEGMHVDPGSDSLIIPFISAEHSGYYECPKKLCSYHIFVCSDLETTRLTFSQGGSVALGYEGKLNATMANCDCYQALGQEGSKLIGQRQLKRKPGWKSTKNVQLSLTLTNLTQNDSGEYHCLVWGYTESGTPFCYDKKIHLLHQHPFGIESTFCAVICVHLMARGRDQTSQERLRRTAEPPGRPTREGEQSGGDPECDDVDTAIDIRE